MCRVPTGGGASGASATTCSVSVSTGADARGVSVTAAGLGADEAATAVTSTGPGTAGGAVGAAGVLVVQAAATTIAESGGHRAPCRDSMIAAESSVISTQEPPQS